MSAVALDRGRCRGVAKGFVDVLPDDHRRDRRVAPAERLRDDHDVGHDVPVLDRPHLSAPAAARDCLVDDQEDAVLVADLADARPVVRIRDPELRDRDGLADHGRDRVRPLHLDRRPDRLRRGDVVRPGGRHHVDRARRQRVEERVLVPPAGDGGPADAGAVVRAVAGDELVAVMVTAEPVVLARELDRRLGRLGPGARQVAPVHVAGSGGCEPFRELHRTLGREEDRAGARDPARLRRVRVDDVFASVPERRLPHRRAEVEVAVAAVVRQPAALALDEDAQHVAVEQVDARTLVDP